MDSQTNNEEALLSAARACAAQITSYYRVLGHSRTECTVANSLWSPENPGISLDFVPEKARLGIEQMALEAGIALKITDGGLGKQAYYKFEQAGLTVDKLEKMRQLVQKETDELIKERGRHSAGHEKPAARGYTDREFDKGDNRGDNAPKSPHKPHRKPSGRHH